MNAESFTFSPFVFKASRKIILYAEVPTICGHRKLSEFMDKKYTRKVN